VRPLLSFGQSLAAIQFGAIDRQRLLGLLERLEYDGIEACRTHARDPGRRGGHTPVSLPHVGPALQQRRAIANGNEVVKSGRSRKRLHFGRSINGSGRTYWRAACRGYLLPATCGAGSVKRIASAVGEGWICIQFVHRVLRELAEDGNRMRSPPPRDSTRQA
jgi:hypothetical protein